eukprot:scaffold23489_cov31-Tisochrysis_lutea.AAC.2
MLAPECAAWTTFNPSSAIRLVGSCRHVKGTSTLRMPTLNVLLASSSALSALLLFAVGHHCVCHA